MSIRTRSCFVLLCCCLLPPLAACAGGSSPQAADEKEPAQERPAKALPLPGAALPPGHPPVDAGAKSGAIGWDAPEGWEEQQPSSSMRYAQYRVPGSAGDGECVVYYFGPGQGGDPMANAVRWAGQFEQPDGRSSVDVMQVTPLDGASFPTRIVEVTGTYDGGMTMTDAPAQSKPGYMLLGAIVQGPDAPWFFKFTGPESTVRGQRRAFVGMVESIRTEAQ